MGIVIGTVITIDLSSGWRRPCRFRHDYLVSLDHHRVKQHRMTNVILCIPFVDIFCVIYIVDRY